jgi:hypothetical protein
MFIEHKLEKKYLFLMKRKNHVSRALIKLIKELTKDGRRPRVLYSDQAPEYFDGVMGDVLEKYNIRSEKFMTYTKNGNIVEPANDEIADKATAQMRQGCAPLESWGSAALDAASISNDCVKTKSPNLLLRQFTPNQLWNADTNLVSKAIEQVHNDPSKFDVASFALKLDKPNLHYRRVFWSRATIMEQDKAAGNLQGKSQTGEWRYVGVAKNGVGFKVLNLHNLKTKEVATARFNEETDDIKDKLTGLDRNGGVAALSDPDLGERIMRSWDLTGKQDIRSPLGDLQGTIVPDLDEEIDDENSSSASDESEEEASAATADPSSRPTARIMGDQADYSGDLKLLSDTRHIKMPRKTGLDDGEQLRVLKKRTRSVKVQKRSHQSHNSESRSTLDNAVDNPGESIMQHSCRFLSPKSIQRREEASPCTKNSSQRRPSKKPCSSDQIGHRSKMITQKAICEPTQCHGRIFETGHRTRCGK